MGEFTTTPAQEASLEILRSAADIVQALQPQLTEQLAADDEHQMWATEIADAAARIQQASHDIFEQASGITVEPVVEAEQTTAMEPSAEDPYIETTGLPQETESTEEQPTTLVLTAEDQARLAKSLGYLAGRKLTYIGKVIKRAFGSQNITTEERNTFRAQLDALVAAGVLESKHQKYAFRPDVRLEAINIEDVFVMADDATITEETKPEAPEVEPISLSELEVAVLKTLNSGEALRTEEIKAQTPEISSMNSFEYSDFKAEFPTIRNRIAAFLIQHGLPAEWEESGRNRGRRYALHIEATIPEDTAVDTPAAVAPEGLLTDREQQMYEAIVKSTEPGEWFRRNMVDLTDVEFVSDYAEGQAFRVLTRKLVEAGILIATGRQGGRKYMRSAQDESTLVPEESTSVSEDVYADVTPPTPAKPQEETPTDQEIEQPVRELTEAEVHARFRRAARFATRLITFIDKHLDQQPDQKEKISTLRKNIAAELPEISMSDATDLINDVVRAGYFYKNGTRRGSRLLAKEPPIDTATIHQPSQETNGENEAWTPQDTAIASAVFDDLLSLKHVTQGKTLSEFTRSVEATNIEATSEEIRKVVRMLTEAGILDRYFSRQNQKRAAFFRIKDQEVKIQLREDRESIISLLKGHASA